MLRNLKLCHLSRDLNCFRKTLDYQIDLKVYFTIQLYIRNGYISLEHKKMSNISKDANSFIKALVEIQYRKQVKHFGVIAILHHILYHSILNHK